MNSYPPKTTQARGFSLIELLIVVAIVGIIAAILIPNLIDAIQKGKQKRTVADIKLAGTSWFTWLTDQAGAAAAGASQTFDWSSFDTYPTHAELTAILTPRYAAAIPKVDGWGNLLDFGLADDIRVPLPVGIRAPAGNGTFETDSYTSGSFLSTDYTQDIVWAGGFFLRWPTGQR